MLVGTVIGIVPVIGNQTFLRHLTAPLSRASHGSAFFAVLVLLFFCQYICIIIHETGHLAAGLSAGLRFNFISFGPLLINRDLKVSLHWKQRSGAAGLTSMIPNGNHRLRWRLLVMILGGPLANLLSAAFIMAYESYSGHYYPILDVLLWVSLAIGLVNLVPFRFISVLSDGKRIWFLLSHKQKGERWLAVTQLVSALMNGVLPEQMDQEMLKAAVSFVDDSPDTVSAHALAYVAAFANHQDDQAAHFLEICLAYCRFTAPSGREGLFISAAIFQARRRKRVDLAEQWLADVPAQTQTPGIRAQAEAAILEAQGKIGDALAKLKDSKKQSATIAQPSTREITMASLDRWEKELLAENSPVFSA
jgi:hypothetical protein